MTLSASVSALLVLAMLALNGCAPSAQSQLEDEKEPHFLAGKNHVSTMDYQGAIECFDKALEVNPQNAAAHFELACLFDQKEANPADAIYHYEHYLKLRPNAGNADVIKQRILASKQALAQAVSLGPITEKVQREFEQMTEENKRLTEENKRLHDELDKLHATGGTETMATAPRTSTGNPAPVAAARNGPAALASANNVQRPAPPIAVPAKTHTVKAGETPTLIARHYGIKVDVLMAANPRLDPRKLRVGQALSIPGS